MQKESFKVHVLRTFAVGDVCAAVGEVVCLSDIELARTLLEVKAVEPFEVFEERKKQELALSKRGEAKFPKKLDPEEDEIEDEGDEPSIEAISEKKGLVGFDHIFEKQQAGIESDPIASTLDPEEDEIEDEGESEAEQAQESVEAEEKAPVNKKGKRK